MYLEGTSLQISLRKTICLALVLANIILFQTRHFPAYDHIISFGLPFVNTILILSLQLNGKIEKSAKKLAKLNSSWQTAEPDLDLETITEEERECLRKIGLKLSSCLVLGEGKTVKLS